MNKVQEQFIKYLFKTECAKYRCLEKPHQVCEYHDQKSRNKGYVVENY